MKSSVNFTLLGFFFFNYCIMTKCETVHITHLTWEQPPLSCQTLLWIIFSALTWNLACVAWGRVRLNAPKHLSDEAHSRHILSRRESYADAASCFVWAQSKTKKVALCFLLVDFTLVQQQIPLQYDSNETAVPQSGNLFWNRWQISNKAMTV